MFPLLAFVFCSLVVANPLTKSNNDQAIPANWIVGQYRRLNAEELRANVQLRVRADGGSMLPTNQRAVFDLYGYVGTPSRRFSLAVESGTKETFISGLHLHESKPWGQHYDPRRSSTSTQINNNFLSSKGKVNISGSTVEDKFSFHGEYRQRFGVVNKIEGLGNHTLVADGVVGLSWNPKTPIAAGPTASVIVNILAAQKKKVYQLFVSPNLAAITFGAEDLCRNQVNYFALIANRDTPLVLSSSFSVGKYHYADDSPVSFDTGFSSIFLPTGPHNAVVRLFTPKYNWDLDIFTVACKQEFPDLELTLGNDFDVRVRKNNLVYDIGLKNDECAFAFGKDTNPQPQYTLGTPFFERYCVSFDLENKRVGIASGTWEPKGLLNKN